MHQIVFVSPDGTREVVVEDTCESIMRELVSTWNYVTEGLNDGVYEFVTGESN